MNQLQMPAWHLKMQNIQVLKWFLFKRNGSFSRSRRIQNTFKNEICQQKKGLPLHTDFLPNFRNRNNTIPSCWQKKKHHFPWPALMGLRKAAVKKRSHSEHEIFAFVQPGLVALHGLPPVMFYPAPTLQK